MADISLDDVAHLAKLARLTISDEEATLYADNISEIVYAVATVGNVDTEDIAPMSHPGEITGVMRDDVPHKTLSVQQALDQAPATEDERFEVPQILSE